MDLNFIINFKVYYHLKLKNVIKVQKVLFDVVAEKNPLNIRKNHFLVVNLNFIQNISNSIENRVEKVF